MGCCQLRPFQISSSQEEIFSPETERQLQSPKQNQYSKEKILENQQSGNSNQLLFYSPKNQQKYQDEITIDDQQKQLFLQNKNQIQKQLQQENNQFLLNLQPLTMKEPQDNLVDQNQLKNYQNSNFQKINTIHEVKFQQQLQQQSDFLVKYHKNLIKSAKVYKSNDEFNKNLKNLEKLQDRPDTCIAPRALKFNQNHDQKIAIIVENTNYSKFILQNQNKNIYSSNNNNQNFGTSQNISHNFNPNFQNLNMSNSQSQLPPLTSDRTTRIQNTQNYSKENASEYFISDLELLSERMAQNNNNNLNNFQNKSNNKDINLTSVGENQIKNSNQNSQRQNPIQNICQNQQDQLQHQNQYQQYSQTQNYFSVKGNSNLNNYTNNNHLTNFNQNSQINLQFQQSIAYEILLEKSVKYSTKMENLQQNLQSDNSNTSEILKKAGFEIFYYNNVQSESIECSKMGFKQILNQIQYKILQAKTCNDIVILLKKESPQVKILGGYNDFKFSYINENEYEVISNESFTKQQLFLQSELMIQIQNENHQLQRLQKQQETKLNMLEQFIEKQQNQIKELNDKFLNQISNLQRNQQQISQKIEQSEQNNIIQLTPDDIRNKFTGYGQFTTSENTYIGQFYKGMKHGKGTIKFFSTKDEYTGDWVDDKRTGYGKYTWGISQNTYEGEFKQDYEHGKGTFTWHESGNQYIGDFIKNEQTGHGKFIWKQSQQVYDGQFFKGYFQGFGKLYKENKILYEGEWKNDKMVN
ncbi:hypothetical protein PPERSA_08983 [Pseudocohnilembus persalinus]|uniref:MORN motif n=1 Tax=Pseudocohnilembus persalinus TaxID=266149 RepID=A0A0V0R2Y8_PSEPJ|nr:hypothetical protein PPERSA_08983 [Pseudocohnilembus persalinus]|eukprot:KRX08879.1 hypothetical protein PPERSA_08983 [Pseudocohnilembus persalinus]